ncbi:MAG: glycosyltransferase family 4 protein [Chloroflexi bacterium]|nr:glycosyltransferase family 4 protein [Chloroflexota bacterium]
MKVQVVSSKYQPEYSGSGLRAHRTHLRLRERYGIETGVICSSTEFTDPATYELDGISVTRILSSKLRKVHWSLGKGPLRRLTNAAVFHHEARRVTAALRSREFDLLHVFGYSPATVAAIRWARRNDVPLMLELVNMVRSPYQYLPGTRRYSTYDLNERSVIVAISRELGETSERAGLNGNIWVRPNPVDVTRFVPVAPDIKQKNKRELFGFGPETRTIVYVAKFLERKNHGFLIDVLRFLPDNFKLVLAGPPLPEIHSVRGLTAKEIPSLTRKAQDLGVGDRLIVRPEFIDFAEYLHAADVTCFPSVREAMGTPLLESLVAGVPVVANAGESSFRDHIVDARNGYLRSLDPEEWADAIVSASGFSAHQRKLFSTETRERFSTERSDDDYQRLMIALVASGPGQRLSVAEILGD